MYSGPASYVFWVFIGFIEMEINHTRWLIDLVVVI